MIPHDQLFKRLLGSYFKEFLELFFPEVVAYTDLSTLTPMDKELIGEGEKQNDEREADLVFKARFKEEEAFFLIHVEPQARSEGAFPFRMLEYCLMLLKKYQQLKICPIAVISWDKKTPAENGYKMDLPNMQVIDFNYLVVQLSLLDWHDYVDHYNPVAAALMAKMKIAENERVQAKVACFKLLFGLNLSEEELKFLTRFVDIYIELEPKEKEEFKQAVEQIKPKGDVMIDQIMTSWERDGLIRGREEGRQEGRVEGERDSSLRLLRKRFGGLSVEQETAISGLNLAQLEQLSETLLDFKTAQDLDTWLKTYGTSQN